MEENFLSSPLAVITFLDPSIRKETLFDFAQSGHDILLNATPEEIKTVNSELRGLDVKLYSSSLDLSTYTGVEEFFRQIRDMGRPVDVFLIGPVNENGLSEHHGDELSRQFSIIRSNTLAPVHLLYRIKDDLVQRGSGKIIILTDIQHQSSLLAEASLKASKAFLQSYGKSLRKELAGTGIEVVVGHARWNGALKETLQGFAGRYLPQYVMVNLQK